MLAAGDDGVCDLTPPGAPAGACGPTPRDPRITAIIPLDGSYQLLHFAELARVHVPALALGEEWANAAMIMPAWQARAHAAFSGSPSYRVDIARTIHMSFANLCESITVLTNHGVPDPWMPGLYSFLCEGPFMPSADLHRIVNEYVLAFLTHQQSVLTPGFALMAEPDVEFFETERRSPSAIDEDLPSEFIYFMHQPGRGRGDILTAVAAKDPPGPPPDAYGIRSLGGAGGR